VALALGRPAPTLATVASALAAVAIAIAVVGRSCGVAEPGPEVTVRDLLQAAKAGDVETIFTLLSPATRERLELEARRATDIVGASVRYSAMDLISIGDTASIATPTDITVVEQREDRAVVLVVSPAGRAQLELVRVDGAWRLELPAYQPLR
jgi:hypothetical protein